MKKTIAILGTVLLLLTGIASSSLGQDKDNTASGQQIKVLSAINVDEKIDGESARASTVEVTLAPGGSSAPHRHPGPVFGYVIEGTFEFKIKNKPMQTLKAGDTFYEPSMVLHEIGRNPSDKLSTRVLAVIVHPRDADQLVIPEESKKESD